MKKEEEEEEEGRRKKKPCTLERGLQGISRLQDAKV
jgi:hypothetical protein